MKDKVTGKYFNYDSLFYGVMGDLISRGQCFIDRKLIDIQERLYYINNVEVTEDEFFKDIPCKKCYFEDHTYMSRGLTVYNKKYRNTLSLEECIELYKSKLDEVDLFILSKVSKESFCHRDYDGNIIIPNKNWNK